jgi:hypothetical protein
MAAASSPEIWRPVRIKFRGALLTDQRRQRHGGDRRIARQLDFRKSPGGIARGVNHIADGGEFRASAETNAADGGNRDFARGHNRANHRMKTREHFVNLFGEVSFDIHAGGERAGVAFEDDDGMSGRDSISTSTRCKLGAIGRSMTLSGGLLSLRRATGGA